MKRPLEPSPTGLGRIVGITDGVFAIALTLIVLEIHVPSQSAVHSERELIAAVAALAPRFLTYVMSFLTLTIFWFGQQAQHGLIERADRRLATLHLLFLGFIALLPFSTDLLADFLEYRTAVLFYWLNLLMLGITPFRQLAIRGTQRISGGGCRQGNDRQNLPAHRQGAAVVGGRRSALLCQPDAQRRLRPGGPDDICDRAAPAPPGEDHRLIRFTGHPRLPECPPPLNDTSPAAGSSSVDELAPSRPA